MTLAELVAHLRRFADAELSLAGLRVAFLPALHADPLGAERSDARPWAERPDDTRLVWRLIHLFDTADDTHEARLRAQAARLAHAVDDAGSATTLELLRVLLDQERLCTIVERHARGVVSRTGFLSVVAESGYPAHVKLWLAHADPAALARLCDRLARGRVAEAAAMVERAP